MKIIHITPKVSKVTKYYKFNGFYDEWNLSDPHQLLWATRFVTKTMKYSNKYDIESWTLYDEYGSDNNEIIIESLGSITFKLFPARKIGPKYISIPLLKELKKRIKKKEKILVHLQSVHDVMSYLIAMQCRNIPLLAQQRGPNCPPMWAFKFNKNPIYLLLSVFNHIALKNFDFIFSSAIGEVEYIKKKLGPDRVMHQKGSGFNFGKYISRPKEEVRKELGLPLNKKIMIHVGRFNKLKGVDVILDVFNDLKKKRDDIEMVFIGGNETQLLYKDIVESGAIVKGYVPKDEVIKYINASDVHLLPTESKKWIPFGDIPTALIESLAMNQPVVSPMLIHFAGPKEERKKLGIMANRRKEVLKAVEYIFDHSEEFKNTREIMKKYYTWERVIGNNVKVYAMLFEKYY